MQLLFILSFSMTVLAGLFVGHALAGGHSPYMGTLSALTSMLALILPFLSEYNVLHRGFASIGDNFKNLMGAEEHKQGEVEILLPSDVRGPAKSYHLEHQNSVRTGVIIILIVGIVLLGVDAVDFYVYGDGLKSASGPISNF